MRSKTFLVLLFVPNSVDSLLHLGDKFSRPNLFNFREPYKWQNFVVHTWESNNQSLIILDILDTIDFASMRRPFVAR